MYEVFISCSILLLSFLLTNISLHYSQTRHIIYPCNCLRFVLFSLQFCCEINKLAYVEWSTVAVSFFLSFLSDEWNINLWPMSIQLWYSGNMTPTSFIEWIKCFLLGSSTRKEFRLTWGILIFFLYLFLSFHIWSFFCSDRFGSDGSGEEIWINSQPIPSPTLILNRNWYSHY